MTNASTYEVLESILFPLSYFPIPEIRISYSINRNQSLNVS
jgi:hypothetical protein